jgi:hypothetical protein
LSSVITTNSEGVSLLWKNGATLTVTFVDGDAALHEKVKQYASEWTKYANLKFDFKTEDLPASLKAGQALEAALEAHIQDVKAAKEGAMKAEFEGRTKEWARWCTECYRKHRIPQLAEEWNRVFIRADIRISFKGKELCSAVGTDSLLSTCQGRSKGEPSMYLGSLDKYSEDAIRGYVLHEFGHALGLQHEHQNPKAGFKWDREFIYQYCQKEYRWDAAKVDRNILDSLKGNVSNSDYDPKSVMLYHFPPEWTLDRQSTPFNTTLSETDKVWIAKMYPK